MRFMIYELRSDGLRAMTCRAKAVGKLGQIVAGIRRGGPWGPARGSDACASTRFGWPSETEVQKRGCNGVKFQGFWLEGVRGEEVLRWGGGCVGSGWFFASYGTFSPFFTCFSPPVSALSGLCVACYTNHTPINDTQCKIISSKFKIEESWRIATRHELHEWRRIKSCKKLDEESPRGDKRLTKAGGTLRGREEREGEIKIRIKIKSKRARRLGFLLDGGGGLRQIEGARAHGMWTYESRQGRNAATAVCSASAVVTLALSIFDLRFLIFEPGILRGMCASHGRPAFANPEIRVKFQFDRQCVNRIS
jgi:hypothetical protein